MDPWTSTRRDTVPRPGRRKADPAARILRGTVVLIHRAGPFVTVVVVRARMWGRRGGEGKGGCAASCFLLRPILLACLRVATTQAPPRGWVVTVRSTVGVDRIPNWVGDVGTWGLLGRGRLSLEVRGKRRTLHIGRGLASITSAVDAVTRRGIFLFFFFFFLVNREGRDEDPEVRWSRDSRRGLSLSFIRNRVLFQ